MNARPIINFFDALKDCLRNYASFKGRARRSEYWWFMLVINVLTVLLITLMSLYLRGVLGIRIPIYSSSSSSYSSSIIDYRIYYDRQAILALIIITTIYGSCIMLPVLSSTVRRLHDVGKRGEYIFIGFVPFFGGLALLVLLCLDSHQKPNIFGPSPKYGTDNLDIRKIELNSLTNQMIPDNNSETQN